MFAKGLFWLSTAYLTIVWDTTIAGSLTAAPSATALWVIGLASVHHRFGVLAGGLMGLLLDAGQRSQLGSSLFAGLLVAWGLGSWESQRPELSRLPIAVVFLATLGWLLVPPLLEVGLLQTNWEASRLARPLLSAVLTMPLAVLMLGSRSGIVSR